MIEASGMTEIAYISVFALSIPSVNFVAIFGWRESCFFSKPIRETALIFEAYGMSDFINTDPRIFQLLLCLL